MYRKGDHYVLCDRTGFKILRSEAVLQHDGLLVKRGHEDPRHPAEMEIRTRPPRVPRVVRPEPDDTFLAVDEVTEADL